MKYIKYIIILVSSILLVGCGAGTNNIINPTPHTYTVESTSKSPFPGTLENYSIATDYSTDTLTTKVNDKICLPNTSDAVCSNNKANLATDFNFNLSQITNGNSVRAYSVQYNTPGVYGENRSVSGGVLIPQVPDSQIKGIILYFHGTSVSKTKVPSCFEQSQNGLSYCLSDSSEDGGVLGGIFASQGYIVVMPDYIGQGFDNVVMHPYVLYPKANATSGINMVIAAKALLTKINVNPGKNFYITGFSEGGAYSLWASNILQNTSNTILNDNNLTLKATIGLSGAYDLQNAQLTMETDNVTLGDKYNIGDVFVAGAAKPAVVGYMLSAYGFYDLEQKYNSLMQTAFFNCTSCLLSGTAGYTIPDLFTTRNNPQFNEATIGLYLDSAAAFTGYGVNGNNSAKALINSDLPNDKAFLATLSANSILALNSATPISLVYLNHDSVVTNLNSTNAYTGIVSASKSAIVIDTSKYLYHVISKDQDATKPVDHPQSKVFQLIAALKQFKLNQ